MKKNKKILYTIIFALIGTAGLIQIAGAEKYTVGSSKQTAQKEEKTLKADTEESASDTLVIKARLLEIPGVFPPNDLYNYVYVMKYRVLKVERGTYEEREILVGHYNPRVARGNITGDMDTLVDGDVGSFEVGDKHKLVLVKPLSKVWDGAVEDEYFDYSGDKYFAVKADKAK